MAASPGRAGGGWLDSLHSLQVGATHACNETNPCRPARAALRTRLYWDALRPPDKARNPAGAKPSLGRPAGRALSARLRSLATRRTLGLFAALARLLLQEVEPPTRATAAHAHRLGGHVGHEAAQIDVAVRIRAGPTA